MLHWQTIFNSKTPNSMQMQPLVSLSSYLELIPEMTRLVLVHSMTVGSSQSTRMIATAYASHALIKFCGSSSAVGERAHLRLARHSPSFWMNDLRSQLPGSLHQTWPTLIINDSGGQCPIFKAESSVMPGQTKPPEFHHSQLLLTPK